MEMTKNISITWSPWQEVILGMMLFCKSCYVFEPSHFIVLKLKYPAVIWYKCVIVKDLGLLSIYLNTHNLFRQFNSCNSLVCHPCHCRNRVIWRVRSWVFVLFLSVSVSISNLTVKENAKIVIRNGQIEKKGETSYRKRSIRGCSGRS